MRRAGALLLGIIAIAACGASWLAPNPPNRRFADLLYAPPTRVHIGDGVAVPHVHPLRIASRLERRFDEDRSTHVRLEWFSNGVLVSADPDNGAPLLLLGADAYGRDRFARLLHGARATLALAVLATLFATLIGALIGGVAGYAGGWLDSVISRTSEFVVVLPAIYVTLALRALMPLVLPGSTIFILLLAIFALLGWPMVARGVRAIVIIERDREYAVAARAAGASGTRLLTRHLLPAAGGYLGTQATLLLPAFILAESTMSYVGLGFPDTTPTWGTMLQDASNVALLGDAPWALAPAGRHFHGGAWRQPARAEHGSRACTIGTMKPFAGIYTPIATPFRDDGGVDERALAANVARWMTTPLTGLVVLGSNGEATQLEDEEADRVVEIVRAGVPSSRPLIAGTGRESTRATIAATRRAAAAGVDAVLVRTPSFFKPQMTTDAFVRHFSEVADASPVPVLLYNVTLYTGVNLLPDAVERLAAHPNIVGIKESGSDVGQMAEYVARTPDDFTVLAGSATTLVHALLRRLRRRDSGAGVARAGRVRADDDARRRTASRRGPRTAAPSDAAGAIGRLHVRRAGTQSRTRIDWLCWRAAASTASAGELGDR